MRKLYLWVFAVMAPVLIYILVFFMNDPYNYFGISKENGDNSPLIAKMIDFRNNDYEAVIIGDSRIAHYDVGELSEQTGLNYVNMAYGGCMTEEMVNLLQWCIDNDESNSLKEITIITSFYNMNTLLQQNRVNSTEKNIKSPLTYAFSLENAGAMLKLLKSTPNVSSQSQEITPEIKQEHFKISAEQMKYYLAGYTYDRDVIDCLGKMCDLCHDKDISVKIVLPPWWKEYYSLLDEYQLMTIIDEYKEELSYHAEVYDFEYPECELSDRYDDFSDYTHFHGDTFDSFVRTVFIGSGEIEFKVWDGGKII